MGSKKSSFIIAAMLAVFSFLTVAYISSCSKAGTNNTRCLNVTCQNGGYCNHIADSCICPTGFEGSGCITPSVNKFLGTWTMNQLITGSDSMMYITRPDTIYTAYLRKTATPTTFYIANFNNNAYYNDVICTLDSLNSSHFYIDTISPFQSIYYSYQILSGGYGYINAAQDSISGIFYTRHRNFTTNWEVDTLSINMVLQSRS